LPLASFISTPPTLNAKLHAHGRPDFPMACFGPACRSCGRLQGEDLYNSLRLPTLRRTVMRWKITIEGLDELSGRDTAERSSHSANA